MKALEEVTTRKVLCASHPPGQAEEAAALGATCIVGMGGGTASSFYYKADRSDDSGITTSVSPALEAARRREPGEGAGCALFPSPAHKLTHNEGVGAQFGICPGP